MASRKILPPIKYPGDLGEPYVRSPFAGYQGLLGGYSEEKAREEDVAELTHRLVLLARFYRGIRGNDEEPGIGSIDWKVLAVSLAFAHVPGLQVVDKPGPKRGRPKRHRAYELYSAILDVMDEKNTSVSHACRILSQRRSPWHGVSPATLERRFHADKRRLARRKSYGAELLGLEPLPEIDLPMGDVSTGGGILGRLSRPDPNRPSAKYPRPFAGLFELPPLDTASLLEGREK